MTANSTACCPDQQKKNIHHHQQQQIQELASAAAAGITSSTTGEASARVGSAIRNQSSIKKDESFCCKLSYADYCSIDGSRDLTTISSISNLQSPQHHSNCRTGKLAEKLFEDEDESDFCASCASHPKINLVLYCCGYMGFMIFAAWIFCMTEKPVEEYYKEDMLRAQVDFLRQHPSVDVESLNTLLRHVTQLHSKKINWEPLHPDLKFLANRKNQTRSSELDRERPAAAAAGETGGGGDENSISSNNAHTVPLTRRRDYESRSSRLFPNKNWEKEDPDGEAIPPPPQPVARIASDSSAGIDYSDYTGSVNWEFTSSLLFVTSLVTTIGYGHISPLTQFGKFLAIIFSMIGIPLTLTLLSTLSSLLLRSPVRRIETSLAIIATRLTSKANVLMVRLSHLILLTIFLLIICFFVPAALFQYMEKDWTYLDAVYFCYISLTTIGLGDYVPAVPAPGDPDLTYYRVASVLFLYYGLTFIMLWLALVYRIPQLNLNQILLSTETDNKLKARETLRILNTCARVQETPSTSRSSISKSYGTQNTSTSP